MSDDTLLLREIITSLWPVKVEPTGQNMQGDVGPPAGWNKARTREVVAALRKKMSRLRGVLLDTGDVEKRRFESQHFDGNGLWSLYSSRVLHDRLSFGLSELSGLQQGATDVDPETIRDVVRDIAVALTGYEVEFTREVPWATGKHPILSHETATSPVPDSCQDLA
jgi:hypothetical protein